MFEPTQTSLPPSFVAFLTKVNEVITGLVTTTGTGLTAGADDEPDPAEPEPDEPEPDGAEGAGADGIDGGGGALKVSDADGLLEALEPIAFLATTVNV
jgi:hypothetical protein